VIFYNVWFSFKAGADERVELGKARSFLDDLQDRAKLHSYRLMKNRAPREKSRLANYQLMAEFSDGAQFGLPFAEVGETGIHAGRHGAMIENVDEFMVEVFEDLT
jgi:predicted GNAT superfamily acetyltransferase